LDTDEEEIADTQREIALLSQLQGSEHHNITRYHGSFLDKTKLWVIMDYAAGGSIRNVMKSGVIEEKFISIVIREMLIALNYIHKQDIIHRDIKGQFFIQFQTSNTYSYFSCEYFINRSWTSSTL
jgi:serine/threonine protein kinase